MFKNRSLLRAGLHILFVVSFPVALVSFAARNSTMTAGSTLSITTRLPRTASGTFAINIFGNAVSETNFSPVLLGSGTLTLSSGNTYTLSITSYNNFLKYGFVDNGTYTTRENGNHATQISFASRTGNPESRIAYTQASLRSVTTSNNDVNSLMCTVFILSGKTEYAGFLSGYQAN
jgi:hypothetical protein